ncbi:hypothetical protein KIW84_012023 [Lathyrus oleraceus]|uniref:Uncharacterized protein n=1 Tax=Pisum sativum TaxID=3888 RepID=A0A9D5BGM3_PEA|nr:hypothetical protein KIW84_012023 [Pisum sativum]
MQDFDDMHVAYRDDAQRECYIALYHRPMAPTRYPDQHCIEALGFQTTPDAIPETPMGYFLGKEVEKFWSDISGGGSQDPSTQLSHVIHNPAFRYFQMILAHSFLGRPDVETLLSEKEIFLLFCASQSRPVGCGNFLLCSLNGVSRSTEGVIHVGGIITQIAVTLGLSRKLLHLRTYCGYTTMDIDFCLTRGLMRRAFFHPCQFRLLVDNEAIHYFTLPDPMMTSVHDPANWSYALEGQGETIEEPRSPPIAEYMPTPPSPRITVFSNNLSLQTPDIRTQITECRREIAELR